MVYRLLIETEALYMQIIIVKFMVPRYNTLIRLIFWVWSTVLICQIFISMNSQINIFMKDNFEAGLKFGNLWIKIESLVTCLSWLSRDLINWKGSKNKK